MPPGDGEAVIAAWVAWDKCPGDRQRAKALVEARVAYAGPDANALQAWIATQRRAGRSAPAAVYSWSPP